MLPIALYALLHKKNPLFGSAFIEPPELILLVSFWGKKHPILQQNNNNNENENSIFSVHILNKTIMFVVHTPFEPLISKQPNMHMKPPCLFLPSPPPLHPPPPKRFPWKSRLIARGAFGQVCHKKQDVKKSRGKIKLKLAIRKKIVETGLFLTFPSVRYLRRFFPGRKKKSDLK